MTDFAAARAALLRLFPGRDKAAGLIGDLRGAKAESDRGNYVAKHARLRELMSKYPHDWHVDSQLNARIVGVTHASGFRFHAPRGVVPDAVWSNPKGVARHEPAAATP